MNIKSLLLGSAAALVAVSGARAADAVVSPSRSRWNMFASATSTALASSTSRAPKPACASAATSATTSASATSASGRAGQGRPVERRRRHQRHLLQARPLRAAVDARSETELGTLRGYAADQLQLHDNASACDSMVMSSTRQFGIDRRMPTLSASSTPTSNSAASASARPTRCSSTFTGYAGGVINDDLVPYGPFDTHQIAYTFNAGNGFSAAVAPRRRRWRCRSTAVEIFDLYTLDSYVPHVAGVGTQGWGGISASPLTTPTGKSGAARFAWT